MHAKLIDRLGGAKAVAEYCGVSRTAAANWRVRGIALDYRKQVARLAHEHGVSLPKGFFDPIAKTAGISAEEIMQRAVS